MGGVQKLLSTEGCLALKRGTEDFFGYLGGCEGTESRGISRESPARANSVFKERGE